METRLKRWNLHRHIKQEHWKYIRCQIEKRRSAGKLSCVSLSGVVLDAGKVARETERYRCIRWKGPERSTHSIPPKPPDTMVADDPRIAGPTPDIPADFAANITTPLPQDCSPQLRLPQTLPWFNFCRTFSCGKWPSSESR